MVKNGEEEEILSLKPSTDERRDDPGKGSRGFFYGPLPSGGLEFPAYPGLKSRGFYF